MQRAQTWLIAGPLSLLKSRLVIRNHPARQPHHAALTTATII
jgi:hypothetical protein